MAVREVHANELKPGDGITGYARQYDGRTVTSWPTEKTMRGGAYIEVELDDGSAMQFDAPDAVITIAA